MSVAAHPLASIRELRRALDAPDAFERLIEGLRELRAIAPELVRDELRILLESLESRRKVCYRCASETIGRRRPKRGQRSFCEGGNCGAEQSQEDHASREPSTNNR